MSTSILVVGGAGSRARRLASELPEGVNSVVSCPRLPSSLSEVEGAGVVRAMVLSLDAVEAYPTDVVKVVRQRWPWMSLILVDGPDSAQIAAAAMRTGAHDYLVEAQSGPEDVAEAVVNARRKRSFAGGETPSVRLVGEGKLIGTSSAMQEVFERVGTACEHAFNVLLHGEAGTGRMLTARAIHAQSTREGAPFVTVDCRCLTPERAREVFLGQASPVRASSERPDDASAPAGESAPAPSVAPSVIQDLQGGTVVLHHVDDMGAEAQNALVHVLERQEEERDARAGVRFIGIASPLPPPRSFRTDLYYRLAELPIRLPPLREREDDVVPLARHFLSEHDASGEDAWTLSGGAQSVLQSYTWPGNVRQLKNVIRRAVHVAGSGTITEDDLILPQHSATEAGDAKDRDERPVRHHDPNRLRRSNGKTAASPAPEPGASGSTDAVPGNPSDDEAMRLHFGASGDEVPSIEELKKQAVKRAYELYDGDVDRAAVALDIGRSTMYRMLDRYGLKDDDS